MEYLFNHAARITEIKLEQNPFAPGCIKDIDYVLMSSIGFTMVIGIIGIIVSGRGRWNRIFMQSHYTGRSAVFAYRHNPTSRSAISPNI